MKTELIVSKNPEAKLFELPEEIQSYDITACTSEIKTLFKLAEIVNSSKDKYSDDVAVHMAIIINNIRKHLDI